MPTALQIVQKFYPNVTEVVDSKRSINVEVTKKDSNSAQVKKHNDCALAVACKRKGADGAIIAVRVSYLIRKNKAYRFMTPTSVAREITSFDRNAGFEPGEYYLSAIPPTSQLGNKKKNSSSGRTAKKKMNYHRTENIRVLGE